MITILGAIKNTIGRGRGGPIWPFNEHENLYFQMNKVSIQGPKL